MRNKNTVLVSLAAFNKEDYPTFLSICSDRDSMNDTWEDWVKKKDAAKKKFRKLGFTVREVRLDPDDFVAFCKQNGLERNGAARSQMAQELGIGK